MRIYASSVFTGMDTCVQKFSCHAYPHQFILFCASMEKCTHIKHHSGQACQAACVKHAAQ
jgi:hypothetical protein